MERCRNERKKTGRGAETGSATSHAAVQRHRFRAHPQSPRVPMRRSSILALSSVAVLAIPVPPRVEAQQGSAPGTRSTLDSVYTNEQATKGREIYANNCEGCHTADSHAGADFRKTWASKPIVSLFAYLRSEMPKSEPGVLSEGEYVLVTAYMLKLNGMPSGTIEFPSDTSLMRLIRFDTTGAPRADTTHAR